MINSLKYAKQLEEAGLTREQAETHMQIITEVMETNLATKQDMQETRQEIKDLETRIDRRFTSFESSVHLQFQDVLNKIVQSEYRSTIKMGTIGTILAGLIVAAIKVL